MTRYFLPILLSLLLLLGGCRKAESNEPAVHSAQPSDAADAITMQPVSDALPALLALDGEADTQTGITLSATEENETVVHLENGAALTLSASDLNKLGDGAARSATGENACIRVCSGSALTLSSSTATTDAAYAPALFVSGDGSAASIVDTMLVASGISSPPVFVSDTGIVTLFGTTLLAEREDSPCMLIENAAITATAGSMRAKASAIARLIGNARLGLENVDASGTAGFVFLLDATGSASAAALSLSGGYLTVPAEQPLIDLTNAHADVRLEGVTITNSPATLATLDGGTLLLTLRDQVLSGTISAVSGGVAALSLTGSSQYTGAFPSDGVPSVSLSLDMTATWQVTGESVLSVLTAPDTTFSGIQSNGYNVYYDSSLNENAPLNAKSYLLPGGGFLIPMI